VKRLLKIVCFLFGHPFIRETPERGICSAHMCIRCGYFVPAVVWSDPFDCVQRGHQWLRATNIEWADATWNPWHGCTKISPGCKFCYMYREKKFATGRTRKRSLSGKTTFEEPLKWARGVGLERNAAGKIVPALHLHLLMVGLVH
jgi:hypothetical protein